MDQNRKRKTRKEKTTKHLASLKSQANRDGKLTKRERIIAYLIVGGGSILYFMGTDMADKTIVEPYTFLKLSAVITLFLLGILYLINKSLLFFFQDMGMTAISAFVICIVISLIITYVNWVSFSKTYTTLRVEVLHWETRKRSGRTRYPVAKIEAYEHQSYLSFRRHSLDEVNHIDSITIELRKGNLGYGVVRDYYIDKD